MHCVYKSEREKGKEKKDYYPPKQLSSCFFHKIIVFKRVIFVKKVSIKLQITSTPIYSLRGH